MLIGDRYIIIKKIGQGCFGKIYLAVDKKDEDRNVAIKAENLKLRSPMLKNEIMSLKNLDSTGIPRVLDYGISV